jgi:tRNA (guanosine-2'-O-)-methyltransferase
LIKGKTCFVFGNEVEGVSQEVMKHSDQIAEIKMNGIKESLNVSVTFAIVMFRILNK